MDEWNYKFPVSWSPAHISYRSGSSLKMDTIDICLEEWSGELSGWRSCWLAVDEREINPMFTRTYGKIFWFNFPRLSSDLQQRIIIQHWQWQKFLIQNTRACTHSNKRQNDWVIHASITPQRFIKFNRTHNISTLNNESSSDMNWTKDNRG